MDKKSHFCRFLNGPQRPAAFTFLIVYCAIIAGACEHPNKPIEKINQANPPPPKQNPVGATFNPSTRSRGDDESLDHTKFFRRRALDRFGSVLNGLVCGYILLHALFFSAHFSKGRRDKRLPLMLDRCVACWAWSWLPWFTIYLLDFLGPSLDLGWWREPVILTLSDLHSAFLILFYFGITRSGQDATRVFGRALSMAVVFIGLADLGLSLLEQQLWPEHDAPHLLQMWSVGIAMFAPFVVGWGLKLRYKTNTPIVIGIVYAVLQPPAYHYVVTDPPASEIVLLGNKIIDQREFKSVDEQIEISNRSNRTVIKVRAPLTDSQRLEILSVVDSVDRVSTRLFLRELLRRDLILTTLALLKIVWAATIIWYLRQEPATMESVVKPDGVKVGATPILPNWIGHFTIMIIAGLTLCIIAYRIVGSEVIYLSGIATLIVGFLIRVLQKGRSLTDIVSGISHSIDSVFGRTK